MRRERILVSVVDVRPYGSRLTNMRLRETEGGGSGEYKESLFKRWSSRLSFHWVSFSFQTQPVARQTVKLFFFSSSRYIGFPCTFLCLNFVSYFTGLLLRRSISTWNDVFPCNWHKRMTVTTDKKNVKGNKKNRKRRTKLSIWSSFLSMTKSLTNVLPSLLVSVVVLFGLIQPLFYPFIFYRKRERTQTVHNNRGGYNTHTSGGMKERRFSLYIRCHQHWFCCPIIKDWQG